MKVRRSKSRQSMVGGNEGDKVVLEHRHLGCVFIGDKHVAFCGEWHGSLATGRTHACWNKHNN